MMKYKVGDKVKIREVLPENSEYWVCDEMLKYSGTKTLVEVVLSDCYRLAIDGGKWSWNDEMLEDYPIAETPCGFMIEGGGDINKEDIRKVLKDHATRTFHDPETDLIERLIPVPLATDIICQYIGIGAKVAASEPEDSKVTRHKKNNRRAYRYLRSKESRLW